MAGPLAHYAKPLRDLLEYIKVFKKFSEGEKVAYLAGVPEQMQEQV
jgi:archaellum biogenesis ATPase FlaH